MPRCVQRLHPGGPKTSRALSRTRRDRRLDVMDAHHSQVTVSRKTGCIPGGHVVGGTAGSHVTPSRRVGTVPAGQVTVTGGAHGFAPHGPSTGAAGAAGSGVGATAGVGGGGVAGGFGAAGGLAASAQRVASVPAAPAQRAAAARRRAPAVCRSTQAASVPDGAQSRPRPAPERASAHQSISPTWRAVIRPSGPLDSPSRQPIRD